MLVFLVENVSFLSYEMNFIQRFVESHIVMFTGNSGLKPKEGEDTSKPWMWPINYRVNSNKSCNKGSKYMLTVFLKIPGSVLLN